MALSPHPTVIDGQLEPRHVGLRPFVIDGRLLPGGISRYAQGAGELVVTARRAVAARASRSYRDSRKSALSLASCEGMLRLSVAR
ncbi:MAG: Circularly permuted ATP-grasp type 2 [bacterium]